MNRRSRLLAIAWKESLHLRRDKRSLAMAFLVPAMLTLLFGYVINFDVRQIRLAVLDQDRTAESRQLAEAFASSGYFRLVTPPASPRDAQPMLENGRARMVLVIPPGYARDLARGEAVVQALLDGSDANTASISLNYANAIARTAGMAGTAPRGVRAEVRVWYNESLKSQNMVVPGLIAVIMMIIAAMLTALTVAREWERGTMEQLAATPVRRHEVIIGKLLPYLAIGLVDVIVAIAIGVFVFGVPLRGSVVYLFANAALFLVGSLGLGVFISAAIKNQLLATQIAMLATYLPSLLLSGLLFDIHGMPRPLQAVTLIVPARYFVTVLRGVFLKGAGFDVLWAQSLGMALFATAGLALAVRAFRKEIG